MSRPLHTCSPSGRGRFRPRVVNRTADSPILRAEWRFGCGAPAQDTMRRRGDGDTRGVTAGGAAAGAADGEHAVLVACARPGGRELQSAPLLPLPQLPPGAALR